MAFRITQATVVGYELACSRCPVVLQTTHDPLTPLPKHRCRGHVAAFDIVWQMDELVLKPGRIDRYWNQETHA